MRWVDRLIDRAERTPYFHLPGYMSRYWLVPYREDVGDGTGPVSFLSRPIAWVLQHLGVAVRIHKIWRSDSSPDPHGHPWPFISVILDRGYTEERYNKRGRLIDKKTYGPGSILWRPYGTHHRVILPAGPVITLFITFKRRGSWNFIVDGLPVNNRDYTGRQ
jgi:hypothetical protein